MSAFRPRMDPRRGHVVQPYWKLHADYAQRTLSAQLNPTAKRRIHGPGTKPGTVVLTDYGECDTPDFSDTTVYTAYSTPIPADDFGIAMEGGPGTDDNTVTYTASGDTAVAFRNPFDQAAQAAPYATDVLASPVGLTIQKYGTYDYTDPKTGQVHKATGKPDKVRKLPLVGLNYGAGLGPGPKDTAGKQAIQVRLSSPDGGKTRAGGGLEFVQLGTGKPTPLALRTFIATGGGTVDPESNPTGGVHLDAAHRPKGLSGLSYWGDGGLGVSLSEKDATHTPYLGFVDPADATRTGLQLLASPADFTRDSLGRLKLSDAARAGPKAGPGIEIGGAVPAHGPVVTTEEGGGGNLTVGGLYKWALAFVLDGFPSEKGGPVGPVVSYTVQAGDGAQDISWPDLAPPPGAGTALLLRTLADGDIWYIIDVAANAHGGSFTDNHADADLEAGGWSGFPTPYVPDIGDTTISARLAYHGNTPVSSLYRNAGDDGRSLQVLIDESSVKRNPTNGELYVDPSGFIPGGAGLLGRHSSSLANVSTFPPGPAGSVLASNGTDWIDGATTLAGTFLLTETPVMIGQDVAGTLIPEWGQPSALIFNRPTFDTSYIDAQITTPSAPQGYLVFSAHGLGFACFVPFYT